MEAFSAAKLTKALVQIESTDPGAYETAIGDYIFRQLSALPGIIPGKTLRKSEVLPGRFNLMAELPGSDLSAPALIFICHMDTVVVGDGWSMPPLNAIEKDGRIYGRGACDMKSGLACCISAFAAAAERRHKTGELPHRTLKLICTVDEEDFMRGCEAAIRDGWVSEKDWVLDAEPTNGQIQVAHKGRTWFEITVTGQTAHASTPWKGADAIAAMAEIICHIRREIKAAPSHPDLGFSTVTFGQITGGYRPYVVPDSCKLWIDMRLVPPTDTKKAEEIVARAITLAEKEIPGIRASYAITGSRPYIERDDASPLLSLLRRTCGDVTGTEAVVSYFPGYTDTAVIAGTLHNHNCMSYGPGNLECAHQPDEWVSLDDISRCEAVYRRLALET